MHQNRIFAMLLLGFLFTATAYGQTAGGTIRGTMTDPSGAVIPRGQVSIKNVGTGVIRTVTTNESGFYNAPNLSPGSYEITASAQGFNTEVLTGIALTVGAEQVVDLRMRVGGVAQRVEVSGGAPAVELASSTLSHVVGASTIRELPLNGRDWTLLATLQPGVATIRAQNAGDTLRAQRGNGLQLTISGGRPSENNYRLNGISVNDYANTGPGSSLGINLGVDAIQEFSVLTSTYSAEYGRTSGGVVNAVTRSGTNDIHGSGYYFHRNSVLDARNFFDRKLNPNDPRLPPLRRHQFGASAGGPVRKNRTFWFADYEGLREFKNVTVNSDVPSAAARNGQLSTGAVRVDPAVKPFLGIYPPPNGPLSRDGNTGKFIFAGGRISREDYVSGKMDQKFSERDSLNGTYLFDDAIINAPDEFNNKAVSQASRRQAVTLEETHIFSPRLLNVFRAGFSRTVAGNGLSQTVFNPLLKDLSLGFVPGRTVGEIQIPGLSNFTAGLGGVEFNLFHFNSYQFYDDLFLTRGIHSLKFGVGVERDQDNYDAPFLPNGRFDFGSIEAFLTNRPTRLQAMLPGADTIRGVRQTIFGAYIQDDVRWRTNFTINLGLRYEMATVPTEVNGKLANQRRLTDTEPTVGSLFENPTLRSFAPRVGFAWDPFRNGKTSVRGGFGLFDVQPLMYIFVNRFNRTPPFFKTGFTPPGAPLPPDAFPKGAFSLLGPQTFRTVFIETHPSRPYKMQWNLNIQRELLRDLTATVGYVGARGVHLPRAIEDLDIVPPLSTATGYVFPTRATSRRINEAFGRIAGTMWNVDSYYHALQLAVKKRLSRGFQAQGSYTWAKSIDTSSATFSDNEYRVTIGNPVSFDTKVNRGLSDYDLRHNFVFNFLWQIPAPKSWPGPACWLAGGWQLGGIYQASSGTPFTVILNSDRAGSKMSQTRQQLGQRPNLVASPACRQLTNPGNPDPYVKTECFTFPADLTVGNLGRNMLIGPGLSNLDFSLFKNHFVRAISENFNLQFRAEFFNVLNRANFATPDVTRYTIFDAAGKLTGNAGQLAQTQTDPRLIQFGIKFIW